MLAPLCLLSAAVIVPALALAPSPLEAAAKTPLAAAVQGALAPVAIWQGGTTPRAAVLTDDNELGGLAVGTPAVVEAIAEHIASAQHEVLLQVYQWHDDDEASARVRQAIDMRLGDLRAGHKPFRLGLLFGNAAFSEHPLRIERLVAVLEQHASTNPNLRVELLSYDGLLLDILHSKTLVVDGTQALLSTANLYTHGGLASDSFNVAAHVRGPVVAGLMQDWHHARHHARGLVQRNLKLAYLPSEDAIWQPKGAAALRGWSSARYPLQASILSRPARNVFFAASAQNPQAQGLQALFDHAQHHIVAINPALNVAPFKQSIVRAIVERGVEVHLLLSFHMNRWRQHHLMGGDNSDTALELYTCLLQQGGTRAADRLHLYFGTDAQGELALASSSGNIHAKIASFDGHALVVGSTNWDWPSYNSARELSVVLFGVDVASAFERDVFDPRVRTAARPILPHDLPAHAQQAGTPAFDYLQARRP